MSHRRFRNKVAPRTAAESSRDRRGGGGRGSPGTRRGRPPCQATDPDLEARFERLVDLVSEARESPFQAEGSVPATPSRLGVFLVRRSPHPPWCRNSGRWYGRPCDSSNSSSNGPWHDGRRERAASPRWIAVRVRVPVLRSTVATRARLATSTTVSRSDIESAVTTR